MRVSLVISRNSNHPHKIRLLWRPHGCTLILILVGIVRPFCSINPIWNNKVLYHREEVQGLKESRMINSVFWRKREQESQGIWDNHPDKVGKFLETLLFVEFLCVILHCCLPLWPPWAWKLKLKKVSVYSFCRSPKKGKLGEITSYLEASLGRP